MNFFKSLFGGNSEPTPEEEEKKVENNFDTLKFDGIRAEAQRHYDMAVRCLQGALDIKFDHEASRHLATSYIAMGEYLKAYDVFLKMTEAEPEVVKNFQNLARVAYGMKDYKSMSDACQKAFLLDSEDAVTYFLFGQASHGLFDDITAVAMLTKAIMLKSDMHEAMLLRGQVLLGMHQPSEALADAESLIEVAPDNEEVLLLKAGALTAMGNGDEALLTYDKMLEYNGLCRDAFLGKAGLLAAAGRNEEAEALLTEAVDSIDDFAEAYKLRGQVRLALDNKEGSLADVQKALELAPEDAADISGSFSNENIEEKMNEKYKNQNPYGF